MFGLGHERDDAHVASVAKGLVEGIHEDHDTILGPLPGEDLERLADHEHEGILGFDPADVQALDDDSSDLGIFLDGPLEGLPDVDPDLPVAAGFRQRLRIDGKAARELEGQELGERVRVDPTTVSGGAEVDRGEEPRGEAGETHGGHHRPEGELVEVPGQRGLPTARVAREHEHARPILVGQPIVYFLEDPFATGQSTGPLGAKFREHVDRVAARHRPAPEP